MNKKDAEMLAKLLGMMGSAHDGECLNAARKAHAHLAGLGLTWFDALNPTAHDRQPQTEPRSEWKPKPPEPEEEPFWLGMVRFCLENAEDDVLSAASVDFLHNMEEWPHKNVSPKQFDWIERCFEQVRKQMEEWI